jgi:malate dehydrogenase (oxaloacetate-decarboxylating)(NADP+)
MFLTAARVLARLVTEESLAQGSIYPPLTQIREVSAEIAAAVARLAQEQGLATREVPRDALAFVKAQMYEAVYESYV